MYFPSELIDQILCWVPVKDLVRCRCVSKEWLSIIDSDLFVKKHLKRNVESNTNGVVFECDGNFYLTDNDSLCDRNVDVVDINDLVKSVVKNAEYLGAAKGLVCFCEDSKNEFVLFNPSIRRFRKVLSVPSEFVRTDGLSEVVLCGFGYDYVNDDYKVVRMAMSVERDQYFCLVVIVYSMKMNSWTRVEDVPGNICITPDRGRFASGVLYWLAIKYEDGEYFSCIVGFDLGLGQFMEIPCPIAQGKFFYLVSLGESLCILHNRDDSRMDVWLMNSCGVEITWYKAFGSFKSVKPITFSGSGQDVLLEVDGAELIWCDLEKQAAKNVTIRGIPNKFVSYIYTESLLLLPEGRQLQKPSPDKKEKKQRKKWENFLCKGFKLKQSCVGRQGRILPCYKSCYGKMYV